MQQSQSIFGASGILTIYSCYNIPQYSQSIVHSS